MVPYGQAAYSETGENMETCGQIRSLVLTGGSALRTPARTENRETGENREQGDRRERR